MFEPISGLPMSPKQVEAARSVCGPCPVQRTCLVHALLQPEPFGIWGGFTTQERKRMVRAAEQAYNSRRHRVAKPELEQLTEIVVDWFNTGVLEEKVVVRR
jgi:hypothetical protein